jgi:PatG Domain
MNETLPRLRGRAGSMPVSHIYAIGRIEARFPRFSVEKEFAQVAGRAETAGQTDQQMFYKRSPKPKSAPRSRSRRYTSRVPAQAIASS